MSEKEKLAVKIQKQIEELKKEINKKNVMLNNILSEIRKEEF